MKPFEGIKMYFECKSMSRLHPTLCSASVSVLSGDFEVDPCSRIRWEAQTHPWCSDDPMLHLDQPGSVPNVLPRALPPVRFRQGAVGRSPLKRAAPAVCMCRVQF